MGNDSAAICPKCGAALAGDTSLCLKCLGRFGLAPDPAQSATLRLGDYELLEEIARGGMGVVYRARQLSLNRIVAVKVVLHGPFCSPDAVRRFQTEAEATATLRHPNIVSVYEVGEYDGHHFLAMEYVEGRSLADLVREHPLPARRAAGYVKLIAQAVHHAHQRGVLHRDLKPSNVLLDAFDQPRVTDFGLAKILDREGEVTVPGQVLGSPNHMPPEQAAGNLSQTTAQSDIYSLGAILYQLVSGRPPFLGGTLAEVLVQVQTVEPLPPRQLNPGVPADLQSICLKCLRKDPARRYGSALELAADLGRFLDHQPVLARPVSIAERFWLWCRGRPVLASLSLGLAAAVIAGLGGVLWQWRRAELLARQEAVDRRAAEENAARARLSLYAGDVYLAAQALKDGDYGLARRTLAGLRPGPGEPDLRGFEWRYLWNRSRGAELATLTGHQWIVTCAAFSPDGRQLVTGGMAGDVRVWDLDRRACLREFNPDAHAVWSLAFTPDGRAVMIAGAEGVEFRDTSSWEQIAKLPGKLAALSRDGATVAVAASSPFYFEESGAVTLWDWRAGRKLRTFGQEGRVLALSPDARRLAVAAVSTNILLYDTASGALLRTLPTQHSVWSLNFSPDGRRLLSAGWCGRALLWDLEADSTPREISANRLNLWSATFTPDGSNIVTTSSDQTVRLWDSATLRPKAVLHGHANEVWCAAVSPDGQKIASGGKDQNVMLWRIAAATRRDVLPCENGTRPVFAPAGSQLLVFRPEGNGDLVLWDTEAAAPAAQFAGRGRLGAGFSADGREMAFLGENETTLEFWPPGASAPSRTVPLRELPVRTGGFVNCGMSPDMARLFAVDAAGVIRVWDTGAGALRRVLRGPEPPIRNLVLSAHGHYLAVSVEREDTVHLFDCDTGGEVSLAGHKDFVSGLAFSPDETALATGSMDGTIRLWTTAGGACRALLPGHMQETTDVAFSPDGRTLASLSQRESLKLWHIPTLREVYSEEMPEAGVWLRFSPDGRRLAVGTWENQVNLLESPPE